MMHIATYIHMHLTLFAYMHAYIYAACMWFTMAYYAQIFTIMVLSSAQKVTHYAQ